MTKHWEHIELVNEDTYNEFMNLNVSIIPSVTLLPNTAVYVQSESGSRRLEGIYDPHVKGIRQLKDRTSPNRDLRLYVDALKSEYMTIVAIDGLMGTGKTSTVVEHLINTHLEDVNISDFITNNPDYKPPSDAHKILIAKPGVNSGDEDYGFLPGDINDKIAPTLRNYTQYFDRLHPSGFDILNEAGYVEILPLGFIRGLDAENQTIVVDECQNTKELITTVTRKAKKNARVFLLGDTSPFQIDLIGNTPKNNGLTDIIELLEGAPYFQHIEMKSLEHIVRSDEVRDIVRRLFRKYGENPQDWIV